MTGGVGHTGGPHHGYPAGGSLPGGKHYMGWWGDFGGPVQKGIVQYSLSSNAQRPLAGMMSGIIFNGAKRTSRYWFYWLPPSIGFYYVYKFLKEKNEYYNSKAGHAYLEKLEAAEAEKAKEARQHTKG